jgi:hypothetical protein
MASLFKTSWSKVIRSMSIHLAALMLAVLGGCQGGSNDQPEAAAGIFQAGGVSGLNYRTATISGTTDAAGTFRYLPGETVTFSVGSVVLGSAPGARAITPFTLSGMTPPTTERALRRELDRARRAATPLVRAMNIGRFLLALDADHDPADGISLESQVESMTNASIDFGLDLDQFAGSLQRLAPNLTREIPNWFPLAHLYKAIGVPVPIHAPIQALTMHQLGDVVTGVHATTFTFGPNGFRTSVGEDTNGDGTLESLESWTYDTFGRITSYRDESFSRPGFIGSISTFTYEHDLLGTLTAVRIATDDDADQELDSVYLDEYEADAFGFTTSSSESVNEELPGVSGGRGTTQFGYDARYNLTSRADQWDADRDGVPERTAISMASYDVRDRKLSGRDEIDNDADGAADALYAETIEYDDVRRAMRDITEADVDANGIADALYMRSISFDHSGNALSDLFEEDALADGVVNRRELTEVSYDGDGRILRRDVTSDLTGTGLVTTTVSELSSFDDIGNLLTFTVERYYIDEPLPSSRELETRSYGAGGEWLGSSWGVTYPNSPCFPLNPPCFSPNPHLPSSRRSVSVINQEFPDGVLLLAQEYLEN